MPSLPPVTQALVLVNVGVFCLQLLLGSFFDLDRLLALWPLGSGFLPWQLGTYAFLHGGMSHLVFNMLGLWMFGSELEQVWGRNRYLQYYAVSVLSAAVAQLVVTMITGGIYPTVGASGGLFGLLLAYGVMFPQRTIVPLIPPIPMKARTYVAVFGALELILGVSSSRSGIAHFAHLGGMLGGWLLLRYWRGAPPFGGKRR